MCRFAPIASILPLSGAQQGVSDCLCYGQPNHRLGSRPRVAHLHKRPASLQSSIHHLPVRRVDCQLGRPDVWQKRHARTPSAPPNSAFACPDAPEYASAARLCVAVAGFSPEAWRAVPPGCTPVLFRARDAGAREPRHSPTGRTASALTIWASRSENQAPSGSIGSNFSSRIAPITASSYIENCGLDQKHRFCFGTQGTVAAPLLSAPIQAEADRRPRI
jgi:hypothetical protein